MHLLLSLFIDLNKCMLLHCLTHVNKCLFLWCLAYVNRCLLLWCFLDVNECLDNEGSCQHVCVNSEGSFHCGCNMGYTLNKDGQTCNKCECTKILLVQIKLYESYNLS